MPTISCRRQSTRDRCGIESIYVGVLDLRASRRNSHDDKLHPYCVLRLGKDQHHRTPSFPPEGLMQVPVRRTTVDDGQLSERQGPEWYGWGIFWQRPDSFGSPERNRYASCSRFERRSGDDQEQKPFHGDSNGPLCLVGSGDRRLPECRLELELYNDAMSSQRTNPLDGFEAEELGVLEIDLSDFLAPEHDPTQSGCTDVPADARQCYPSGGGSENLGNGILPSRVGQARPHAQACTHTGVAKSSRFTKERWFGGVVFPTAHAQHREDRIASPDEGVDVEARLVMGWGAGGNRRSQRPTYDSFGQFVHARHARKCSSAQGLWGIQQRRQMHRWMSEGGRAALSAWPNGSGVSVPPSAHETAKKEVAGGPEWRDGLRDLVWKGVPGEMREGVYMSLSGAALKRTRCGGEYYRTLVSDCEKLPDVSTRCHASQKRSHTCSEQIPDDTEAPFLFQFQEAEDTTLLAVKSPCEKTRHVSPVKSHSRGWRLRRRSHPSTQERAGVQPSSCEALEWPSTRVFMDGGMSNSHSTTDTASQRGVRGLCQHKRQIWQEIEGDLDRVFVNGRSRVNNPAGTASMRRVLRAYSLRNPAIGYCQGMNFVVGLLLQVVSEEAAFWLLAAYCEDIYPEYHTKTMLRARSDIAAVKDIVRGELPRFYSRATEVGMPLELQLTQWLVVGFINCFPPHTALRILEVSFIEGSEVLLATALAFLRLHEAELLEGEDIADMVCLLSNAQSGMYEVDILLKQVWRELEMVGKDIRAARAWHRNRMLREHEAEARALRVEGVHPTKSAAKTLRSYGQDAEEQRGGWLRGRSSIEAGINREALISKVGLCSLPQSVVRLLLAGMNGISRPEGLKMAPFSEEDGKGWEPEIPNSF